MFKLFFAAVCVLICLSCSAGVEYVAESEVKPVFVIPSSKDSGYPTLRFTAKKDTCVDKRDPANDLVAEQWYRNLIRWSDSSPFQ